MDIGAVYTVVRSPGGRYINEAISSASSFMVHNTDIPIQLVTDMPDKVPNSNGTPFSTITCMNDVPTNKLVLRAKIDALCMSKFDRTLFLDTDTFVCGDLKSMFQIMDYYDIAVAYAPRRVDPGWPAPNIPQWLPEFNTGVVLIKKSGNTARFLIDWRQLYAKYSKWNDQIAFRAAIFNGLKYGLKVYPLPPEYNCRTLCMAQLGSKAMILHGRGDMSKIASQINSGNGIRVYIPDIGIFKRKEWKHVKPGS